MIRQEKRWYWLSLACLVALLALYAQRRDLSGHYADYRDSEGRVRILDFETE